MRIATWNVNSLKARLAKVEEWLSYAGPDVLCMQETKMSDAAFPALAFAALGYESAHHGNGRWNGVAILSRVGLENVQVGFSSELAEEIEECRILTASCAGVRVSSVYVPNGRAVGSEQYELKLAWLRRLREELAASTTSDQAVAVCGDFNVAPQDRDVWDISKFAGATHVSEPERALLAELEAWGLVDAFRLVYPDTDKLYSWWDYRAGDFHKGRGMRIDLVLVSKALAGSVRYALIDREARKGMGGERPPSDHAPLFVDLEA
ncbi:MAG: exodeoxyribonuclease III [Acidimicrobiales bacterium]|jgi:exodeoxyribonuclease-3